jgi:regulator of replication initiation timing
MTTFAQPNTLVEYGYQEQKREISSFVQRKRSSVITDMREKIEQRKLHEKEGKYQQWYICLLHLTDEKNPVYYDIVTGQEKKLPRNIETILRMFSMENTDTLEYLIHEHHIPFPKYNQYDERKWKQEIASFRVMYLSVYNVLAKRDLTDLSGENPQDKLKTFLSSVDEIVNMYLYLEPYLKKNVSSLSSFNKEKPKGIMASVFSGVSNVLGWNKGVRDLKAKVSSLEEKNSSLSQENEQLRSSAREIEETVKQLKREKEIMSLSANFLNEWSSILRYLKQGYSLSACKKYVQNTYSKYKNQEYTLYKRFSQEDNLPLKTIEQQFLSYVNNDPKVNSYSKKMNTLLIIEEIFLEIESGNVSLKNKNILKTNQDFRALLSCVPEVQQFLS